MLTRRTSKPKATGVTVAELAHFAEDWPDV
jgi:hypothetical protein